MCFLGVRTPVVSQNYCKKEKALMKIFFFEVTVLICMLPVDFIYLFSWCVVVVGDDVKCVKTKQSF